MVQPLWPGPYSHTPASVTSVCTDPGVPGSWLPISDVWLLSGELELRGPSEMVKYT